MIFGGLRRRMSERSPEDRQKMQGGCTEDKQKTGRSLWIAEHSGGRRWWAEGGKKRMQEDAKRIPEYQRKSRG